MFKLAFLKNFPLGTLVGAIIAFSLAWALDSDISTEAKKNWTYLVSASVTLLAASMALAGVLSNIANQNSLAEKNRLQDLSAWRATLPLALSKLIIISRNGMLASVRLGDAAHWSQEELLRNLEFPSNMMESLRNCIKFSDDESGKWLSVLVGRYQVYLSRSERLMLNGAPPNYDTALDWATFHALVEHCLPFARGAAPTVETHLGSAKICSAFWLSDIEVADNAEFAALVRTRVEGYGMAPVSTFQFRP